MGWEDIPAPFLGRLCSNLTLSEAAQFACVSRACRAAARDRLTPEQLHLLSLFTQGQTEVITALQLSILWQAIRALVLHGTSGTVPQAEDPLHDTVYSVELAVGGDGRAAERDSEPSDVVMRATHLEGSSRELALEHPMGAHVTAMWEPHVDSPGGHFRGFVTVDATWRDGRDAPWIKALLLALCETAASRFPETKPSCSMPHTGPDLDNARHMCITRNTWGADDRTTHTLSTTSGQISGCGCAPSNLQEALQGYSNERGMGTQPTCTSAVPLGRVCSAHGRAGAGTGGPTRDVTRPGTVQILVDGVVGDPHSWREPFSTWDALEVVPRRGRRLTRKESKAAALAKERFGLHADRATVSLLLLEGSGAMRRR
eukprot:jgi/Botrbrau1/10831/Bobra.0025s0010.1